MLQIDDLLFQFCCGVMLQQGIRHNQLSHCYQYQPTISRQGNKLELRVSLLNKIHYFYEYLIKKRFNVLLDIVNF